MSFIRGWRNFVVQALLILLLGALIVYIFTCLHYLPVFCVTSQSLLRRNMLDTGTVLSASFRAVGNLYALAFVGVVFVLLDVIRAEHLRVLSRICYTVFLPSLVLLAVSDTVRNAEMKDLWILPVFASLHWLVGLCSGLVTYYSWLGPPHADQRGRHPLRLAVITACISSNSADIPLALIAILKTLSLFTESQGIVRTSEDVLLRVTGYIALYNMLNIVYTFTIAYHLFAKAGQRFPYTELTSASSETPDIKSAVQRGYRTYTYEEGDDMSSDNNDEGDDDGGGRSSVAYDDSTSGSTTDTSSAGDDASETSTMQSAVGTDTESDISRTTATYSQKRTRSQHCQEIISHVFNPTFTASLIGAVIGAIQPVGDQFVVGGNIGFIFEFLSLLGKAYVPLVMLTLGANIYINGLRSGDASLPLRTLLSIGCVKLVVLPSLAIGLVQLAIEWEWLSPQDTMLQFVLIVVLISPCATFLVIFSQLFNYAIGSFARMVFWQYVACIGTMPAILFAALTLIQDNASTK